MHRPLPTPLPSPLPSSSYPFLEPSDEEEAEASRETIKQRMAEVRGMMLREGKGKERKDMG